MKPSAAIDGVIGVSERSAAGQGVRVVRADALFEGENGAKRRL